MPAEGSVDVRRARSRARSTAESLRRCLDIVRRQDPDRYEELRRHVRQVPAGYQIGAEQFTVVARGERIEVRAGASPSARAKVATGRREVLQLVDGTASLSLLLANDRLRIWGDADSLIGLSSAVRVFFTAALRSGRIQQEFESYRAWVLEQPEL